MTVRVLIIDDDATFRRLLQQHIGVGFESPAVAEFDPARDGRLPADFAASGYDAVLLDSTPGVGTGLEWLKDLTRRAGFPPVIYLAAASDSHDEALQAGADAVLSKRKIENARLVAALKAAQSRGGAQAPTAPTRGEELGPEYHFGEFAIRGYRCIRQLAASPISKVYLGFSEKLGKEVAVKVLEQPPDDGRGTRNFDRFMQEYEIAARIEHPNVVRIHDFGVGDHHAYIAMEYFAAGDLRSRMKSGMKPREAVSLLRQMASALNALHSAGVLHRDLKPGNVMLREDGSVALIDFGLAKQLELDAAITGSGEIFGTPYYMSPEQGHGRETDERSDIYSLGIMLFEMLMRRKPYVAGTPMQVIYKHANQPLPELPADLKRFEPLLYNCIAKDPQRRYRTAEQLADAAAELERDEKEREELGL